MRLQLVEGYWTFDSFSCIGKCAQLVETFGCTGQSPGHLAIRFVQETLRDAERLSRIDRAYFAEDAYLNSGCQSVFFDILRTRVPKFHLLKDKPWSHKSLVAIKTYDVQTSRDRPVDVYAVLRICERYASDASSFEYSDLMYTAAFFPVCCQRCPTTITRGHCVQLVLLILSEGILGDRHALRKQLEYQGWYAPCTTHPPYAAHSPAKAIASFQALGWVGGGRPLQEGSCFVFNLRIQR